MPILYEEYSFDPSLTEYKEVIGAHAIIFNPETKKYLVFEEVGNPYAWDKYSFIGGKSDLGENAETTLLREFEEESGIKKSEITKINYLGSVIQGFVMKPKMINYKYFHEIYYLETSSTIEGFEADQCVSRWLSIQEILAEMGSWGNWLLKNYKSLM